MSDRQMRVKTVSGNGADAVILEMSADDARDVAEVLAAAWKYAPDDPIHGVCRALLASAASFGS